MSIRHSILAILAEAPSYGYELRAEFERRTGAARPLNIGQVYTTLARLERDGGVRKGLPDAQGHIFWTITAAGRDELADWFGSPVLRESVDRDELFLKLALAATSPGVDAAALLRVQREAAQARLATLRREEADQDSEPEHPCALGRVLIADARREDAEAELRWLDLVEARLTAAADRARPHPSSTAAREVRHG